MLTTPPSLANQLLVEMSSSEKDLVRGEEPLSSFGNHPTRSGDHDRSPTPEKLAGPSKLHPPIARIALIVDSLLKGLSWLDRLLAPLVLIAMILGVVVGMSSVAI